MVEGSSDTRRGIKRRNRLRVRRIKRRNAWDNFLRSTLLRLSSIGSSFRVRDLLSAGARLGVVEVVAISKDVRTDVIRSNSMGKDVLDRLSVVFLAENNRAIFVDAYTLIADAVFFVKNRYGGRHHSGQESLNKNR